MAQIRSFTSYLKKKDDTAEGVRSSAEPTYLEKIRSHRLVIFYRTFLGVILLAALIAVSYISWRDKVFTEAEVIRTAPLSEAQGASFLAFGENILQYSKDGIGCMNANGDALWNQTWEMQSPIVRICRSIVAVGDYNGHMIYVAGANGSIGTIDTNLPIRDFCVASQGVVAAVLDDQDVTWIHLYDTQGNQLGSFKTTMADSGYPLAVAISPNGQLVGVSFLYAQEGRIKTSVAFYNFGSVGQNAIDNYVSGYDYTGVVVPYLCFLDDDAVCAVADDRIMFYGGEQIPTSRGEHLTAGEEIAGVYTGNGYAALVYHNNTEEGAYRIHVYRGDGSDVITLFCDQEFEDILLLEDRIVIYSADAWQIFDMSGHEKYAGAFDESVRVLTPTGLRNRFLAVAGSSIQTLELR